MENKKRVKAEDRIGSIYQRLTIIDVTYSEKHKRKVAICKCKCGNVKQISISSLISGRSKSCGCLQKEETVNASTKHGMYKTRLNKEYRGMKQRCYNTKNSRFSYYGGREIKICDEWLGDEGFNNFSKWSIENGYLDTLSIDRINVNGDYSPTNCRWVSMKVQSRNRRVKKNNKTGITGVCSRGEKFRAFITVDYKTIYLGTFDNIEDAKQARKQGELVYWK